MNDLSQQVYSYFTFPLTESFLLFFLLYQTLLTPELPCSAQGPVQNRAEHGSQLHLPSFLSSAQSLRHSDVKPHRYPQTAPRCAQLLIGHRRCCEVYPVNGAV